MEHGAWSIVHLHKNPGAGQEEAERGQVASSVSLGASVVPSVIRLLSGIPTSDQREKGRVRQADAQHLGFGLTYPI